jgi:Tol biopolymer transport system component
MVIAVLLTLATVTGAAQPASAQTNTPTGVRVVVNIGGATLFSAQGDETDLLPPGARVTAVARTEDGLWLQVVTEEGEVFWSATDEIVGFGLSRLPVIHGPSIPAASAKNIGVDSTPALHTASDAAEPTTTMTTTIAATPVAVADATGPQPAGTLRADEKRANVGVGATVTTGQQRLNVRSGPGEAYPVIAKGAAGERLSVIGRSEGSNWLAIQRSDLPDNVGWVAVGFVALDGDVAALPILPWPTAPASELDRATNVMDSASENTLVGVSTNAETPDAQHFSDAIVAGLSGNLVFQDGKGSIYVYDLASGSLRWLASGYSPDVSADGSQVVFVRTGEEAGIWVVAIDGSGLRKVYSSSDLVSSPKWSTDGAWIVFSRLSGVSRCYQMGPTCVTISDIKAQFPQLTPEMIYDRILANAERVETPLWGLARVSANGEDFRDIPALNSARSPDWSSAGIVYQSSAGLEITQDGENVRSQSIFHNAWNWDPDWAWDGGAILYQEKSGSHWEIWRVNPDGSGRIALTRPASVLVDELASNVAPAWSPDGAQVAFLSNRSDDGKEPGPWRLWVMDADGGNQRSLAIDVTIDYAFSGEQVVSWGKTEGQPVE